MVVPCSLAIVISLVALWLTFHCGEGTPKLEEASQRNLDGAAIPIMHYTGMAAVTFVPTDSAPELTHSVAISSFGIAAHHHRHFDDSWHGDSDVADRPAIFCTVVGTEFK